MTLFKLRGAWMYAATDAEVLAEALRILERRRAAMALAEWFLDFAIECRAARLGVR